MAGRENELIYEIGGLKYRKKRTPSEVPHSEMKRSRPAVSFSSAHHSRLPAYAPPPFQPQKDYSRIQPEHRLAVLLSEILEYAETEASKVFKGIPRLMQSIGEMMTAVETRCKEKLYALAADQARVQQEYARNQAQKLSLEEETEQRKKWEALMARAPENVCAAAEIAFYSGLTKKLEERKERESLEIPQTRVVLDKFAVPMQDELKRADEILKAKAEVRRRKAEAVSWQAATQLSHVSAQRLTQAHRVFRPLLPALESDPRKLISAFTHQRFTE